MLVAASPFFLFEQPICFVFFFFRMVPAFCTLFTFRTIYSSLPTSCPSNLVLCLSVFVCEISAGCGCMGRAGEVSEESHSPHVLPIRRLLFQLQIYSQPLSILRKKKKQHIGIGKRYLNFFYYKLCHVLFLVLLLLA